MSIDGNHVYDIGFWHYRSYRLYLTIIMGFAMFATALARATLSIAMVCMVNTTKAEDSAASVGYGNGTTADARCEASYRNAHDYGGDQTWSNSDQSMLFSAIYWGGLLCTLPSGVLADRYSPKWIVTVCLTLECLSCLLTPVAVFEGGLTAFFVARLVVGIGGQSISNTAISVIISRWIPPAERSTVIALYTGGNQIALIIAMPLNAWLCQQRYIFNGWPAIFYVTGLMALCSIIPWQVFVSDKPEKSSWISAEESEHIKQALRLQHLQRHKGIFKKVPWLKMMASMTLWSCIMCNVAGALVTTTLDTYIPTYFKQALHLDLRSNGMLSALPYIAMWASKMIFACLGDFLKTKTSLSHTWICRIFNAIGTIGVSAFLLACAFMQCEQKTLAIFFLISTNFLISAQVSGYMTSLVCIAPAFTGIVNCAARFAGQVASVMAPYIVGKIVHEGTLTEWRIVYYIVAATLVTTGTHFLFFGSAEVQPWAELDTVDNDFDKLEDMKNDHKASQAVGEIATRKTTTSSFTDALWSQNASRETVVSTIKI